VGGLKVNTRTGKAGHTGGGGSSVEERSISTDRQLVVWSNFAGKFDDRL